MNTRRSFFSKIAGLVAAVAIAPEIAFRTKLALPKPDQSILIGWDMGEIDGTGILYACNSNGVYQQLVECSKEFGKTPEQMNEHLRSLLDEVWRARKRSRVA